MDASIGRYRSEASESERAEILTRLLLSLRNTNSVEDDETLEYAVKELAEIYTDSHDPAIVQAFDDAPMDAGYGQFLAGFYGYVKDDTAFLRRCREKPGALEAVRRCVGISLSEREFNAIAADGKGEASGSPRPE